MLGLGVLQVFMWMCSIINLSCYRPLLIFCVFDLVSVGERKGGNRPALVSLFFKFFYNAPHKHFRFWSLFYLSQLTSYGNGRHIFRMKGWICVFASARKFLMMCTKVWALMCVCLYKNINGISLNVCVSVQIVCTSLSALCVWMNVSIWLFYIQCGKPNFFLPMFDR